MLALALLAASAERTASAPLAPTGKWSVEYNAGDCVLSRRFGDPGAPVLLVIRPGVKMMSGDLALIAAGTSGEGREGTGAITLLPAGTAVPVRWASGPLTGTPAGGRGTRFSTDRAFWDGLAGAVTLAFDMGEGAPKRIAVGNMVGALGAVKACEDDLLRSWGADPAAMVEPIEQPSRPLFGFDDYPVEAIRAHQSGRVATLATVDAAGRLTQCKVVQSSGSETLDRETCAIIRRRARFTSAPGGPADRFFYTQVTWELPSR